MNDIRIAHVETKPDHKGKIVAAIVIALAVVAVGAYTYSMGWFNARPKPVVASSELPQISPPVVPVKPKSL